MSFSERPYRRYDAWRSFIQYGATALVLISLLAEPAAPTYAAPNQPDTPQGTTIYNGRDIQEKDAPYYVSLNTTDSQHGKRHYFGSAPVSENGLVSAAHANLLYLGDRVGSFSAVNVIDPTSRLYWNTDLMQPSQYRESRVNAVIFPDDENEPIAIDTENNVYGSDDLVFCTEDLITTQPEQEVLGILDSQDITDGMTATIVGNGLTGYDVGTGVIPDAALEMTATVTTPDTCNANLNIQHLGSTATENDLCVGDPQQNIDSPGVQMLNQGDSGSPVTVKKDGKRWLVGDVSRRLYINALSFITNVTKKKEFVIKAANQCKAVLGKKPPQELVHQTAQFEDRQQQIVLSPANHTVTVSVVDHINPDVPIDGTLTLAAEVSNYDCGIMPADKVEITGGTILSSTQLTEQQVGLKIKLPDQLSKPTDLRVSFMVDVANCKTSDPTVWNQSNIHISNKYYPGGKPGIPVITYKAPGIQESQQNILPIEVKSTQLAVFSSEALTTSVASVADGQSIVGAEFVHEHYNENETIQVIATRKRQDLELKLTTASPDISSRVVYFSATDLAGRERIITLSIRDGKGEAIEFNFFNWAVFLPLISKN